MELPNFGFELPKPYRWLVKRGHVGFEEFTQLSPWYFLRQSIDYSRDWQRKTSKKTRLIAFACRQDNDDVACFEVDGNRVIGIVDIHLTWNADAFFIGPTHDSIWAWLKNLMEEVAYLVDQEPS